MIPKNVSFSMLVLSILLAAGTVKPQSNQKHERGSVLYSLDENTVIRLFYQPPGDYFHAPLVFRVADEGNVLLDTSPMLEEGRTAYVSLAEMRELARKLAHQLGVARVGSCRGLGIL